MKILLEISFIDLEKIDTDTIATIKDLGYIIKIK